MLEGNDLWQQIEAQKVVPGTAVVWWLYQAGLVIKSPGGTTIAIDAYLSDAVRRSYNQPRAVPSPLEASTTKLDAVLSSHSHEDHLDPDSITGFAAHPKTLFLGPPMVAEKVIAKGVDSSRTVALRRGESLEVGDVTIDAVHARHPFAPEPVPDAIGYLVRVDGVCLYHSGDTEYDAEIVRDTKDVVTASFIAINGTAGNMNAHEAALLAWRQNTRLAVPFHYGLWSDAGYGEGATLDPQVFIETYQRLGGNGETWVLSPGQAVQIDRAGIPTPVS